MMGSGSLSVADPDQQSASNNRMNDNSIAPVFDPTTNYWQSILEEDELPISPDPPYQRSYPARLPDGRYLILPLRAIPTSPTQCIASLQASHASFKVIETLSAHLADAVRPLDPEVVVGLPTLGLAIAPLVAANLGFSRYVPFGYSRKYWYKEELAVPVHSITSPDVAGKLLYVDPNLVGELSGKRVLIVDDAISSGQTMVSALELLEKCGAKVTGIGVAMRQGMKWKERLIDGEGSMVPLAYVFDSPRMIWRYDGWWPDI
jgi:adenine/guanine phosphoribosyltransferase-like PRPP-binding protein